MQYVGIDLGVKSCSASIVDEQGDTKEYLEFSNDEDGWKTLVDIIDGDVDVEIAMEVGTCMYPIYDYLTSLDFNVKVGHPPGIKAITGSSSKTDQKDSEILANLLRLNYLPLSYVPTKEIMKAREILRARIMIGRELNRVKNRIHAYLVKNGEKEVIKRYTDPYGPGGRRELRKLRFDDYRDSILRAMLAQLDSLVDQRDMVQVEIAKLCVDDEKVKLLMTINGVDYYSALLIISEIGDLSRFRDVKALCKYAGLVPRVRQSSTTTWMGGITKAGPPTLRWILSVISDGIVRYDNPLKVFYRRLYKRTKSKKLAKTATARKLLVMVYFMLKNHEECRWSNSGLTERKLASLEKCRKKVLVT